MATKHSISCPHCGKSLNVTSEMAGRSGKCNACGNRFVISLPKTPDEPRPIDELQPIEKLKPLDELQPIEEGEFALQPLEKPSTAPSAALRAQSLPAATQSLPAKPPSAASKPVAADSGAKPASSSLIALLVGGAVAALLGCGGLIAVISYLFLGGADPAVAGPGPEGGPQQVANAGGNGGNNAAGNGAPAVVAEDPATIKREPKMGPNSWVPSQPLAAADPATWKVVAEKFPPLPKEALTAIPLPISRRPALHFTTPDVAKLAVVTIVRDLDTSSYPIDWTQHDLRDPKSVKVVRIKDQSHSPHDTNLVTALSPKGDLLAYVHEREPDTIYLWKDDGSPAGQIKIPDASTTNPISHLWLTGDSRLVVLSKNWLKGYDVASGNEAYSLPTRPGAPPTFTRCKKFFAVPSVDRFKFYRSSDGSPAGEILLGAHGPAEDPKAGEPYGSGLRGTFLSFHPQGELLATVSCGPSGEVLIAKWDLASGKPLEQCLLPKRDMETESILVASIWLGERRLLLGHGQLFDFDKHTWIQHYGFGKNYWHAEGPDARLWGIAQFAPANLERVQEHYGITDNKTTFLVACTLPSAEGEAAIANARLHWHPGFRMALDTDETVPAEERAQLVSAVADALAARGFTIDPQSKYKMKIWGSVSKEPNLGRIIGSPDAPKDHVYTGSLLLQLFDDAGPRLMFVPNLPGQRIEARIEGEPHDCWVALGKEMQKSLELPRFARYDETRKDALFDFGEKDRPRIDGFDKE